MKIDLYCYSYAYELIKKFECFEKDALISNCQYKNIIASSIIFSQNQVETSLNVAGNKSLGINEIGYWRQELANMQQTLSWRITKPLRAIRRHIRNL